MNEKNILVDKGEDSIVRLARRSVGLIDFWNKEYNLLFEMDERDPVLLAKKLFQEKTGAAIEFIARDYVDLENDFNFIKNLNEQVAISHSQLLENLPSVEEMDALIDLMQKKDPEDKDFFKKNDKRHRLAVAALLRQAALKETGAK